MPRFNVRYGEKWSCFSSIVDCFIVEFMSRDCYEDWRIKEYEEQWCPLEEANMKDLEDCISTLMYNNDYNSCLIHLTNMGIEKVAAMIMLDKAKKEIEMYG